MSDSKLKLLELNEQLDEQQVKLKEKQDKENPEKTISDEPFGSFDSDNEDDRNGLTIELEKRDIIICKDEFGNPIKLGEGTEGIVYMAKYKVKGNEYADIAIKVPLETKEGTDIKKIEKINDILAAIPGVGKTIKNLTLQVNQKKISAEIMKFRPITFQDIIDFYVYKNIYNNVGQNLTYKDFISEMSKRGKFLTKEKASNIIELANKDKRKLFFDLAQKLCRIHSLGIVHNDLKPNNILLDEYGKPVIIDFGLAKTEEELKLLLKKGEISGTFFYFSPEVIEAYFKKNNITEILNYQQLDVYAFGLIAYQMFAGKSIGELFPYKFRTINQFLKVKLDKGPKIDNLDGVDEKCSELIARMLEPDPNKRPTSLEAYQFLEENLQKNNEKLEEKLSLKLDKISKIISWNKEEDETKRIEAKNKDLHLLSLLKNTNKLTSETIKCLKKLLEYAEDEDYAMESSDYEYIEQTINELRNNELFTEAILIQKYLYLSRDLYLIRNNKKLTSIEFESRKENFANIHNKDYTTKIYRSEISSEVQNDKNDDNQENNQNENSISSSKMTFDAVKNVNENTDKTLNATKIDEEEKQENKLKILASMRKNLEKQNKRNSEEIQKDVTDKNDNEEKTEEQNKTSFLKRYKDRKWSALSKYTLDENSKMKEFFINKQNDYIRRNNNLSHLQEQLNNENNDHGVPGYNNM